MWGQAPFILADKGSGTFYHFIPDKGSGTFYPALQFSYWYNQVMIRFIENMYISP